MDVVCVALGGLGSSFDQLAMNRELLVKHNVRLRGVILNKVNPHKMDMIKVRQTHAGRICSGRPHWLMSLRNVSSRTTLRAP